MGRDKNCPVVVMGGRLEPELCAGEKCAWWDDKQLRCRMAGGTEELERMASMVGAFIEDEWEPVTRVLGDIGNGLIEVGKKLDRLSETLTRKEGGDNGE
jgi:hypothetical protein